MFVLLRYSTWTVVCMKKCMYYIIYAVRVLGDLGGGVLIMQCATIILPMFSLTVGMDVWLLDLYDRG